MHSGFVIRKNQYYDSVFLMSVNRRIAEVKGIQQTAVLMGSTANKKLLSDIGILDRQIEAAQPNDLIVAVIAEMPGIAEKVLGRLDEFLNAIQEDKTPSQIHSIEDGLAIKPGANLAVISVPGEYAAREAMKALKHGLHVFLFSDNVSLEDELELKQLAREKGLLVMGPDCGTSLIGGVGFGFSNSVRKGSIGVIGAAGTGLQEFTSQVHNSGQGIAHAIGTGSHDLSEKIGGLTTLAALEAFEKDPLTKVIALISKPPAMSTLEKLFRKIESCQKPVIGCFLGIDTGRLGDRENLHFAGNIDDAVRLAIETNGGKSSPEAGDLFQLEEEEKIVHEAEAWLPEQKYLRGILAGGTFCYQSQQILDEAGIHVYSNSPLKDIYKLDHPDRSREHSLIDMGDDFYMVGKPHPMIDGTMRQRRILAESKDAQMAILYLDFILGYNASPDPAGELVDAIQEARRQARQRGGHLSVVASLCGTEADPQDKALQESILRETGALVYPSNVQASRACCRLLEKGRVKRGE